ncbi:putative secreted protein [Primorskyibacter sedentarius]|uniref:Putative secreted protein n=1 Tax=Primorskyibacter sedentarius TaxID=745311 RepID=A0A4V6NYB0_9RHOB|nr:hypothetical protein [Primorskyibacter sedentarius]TCS52472.1 putative secreted protein [Primorskyibacter sedentarius]
MNIIRIFSATALPLTFSVTSSFAATMYVHDIGGNLATVETDSGAVSLIGNMGSVMTDIAFDPSGNLYGVTFTGLYSIDATNGSSSFIGNHAVSDANALVFGAGGTLYAAGATTTGLYSLDVGSAANTLLGDMGFASSGDLAFVGSDFYLSSTSGELVSVDLSNPSSSTAVGSFGVSDVFGIATDETSSLFAVAGTSIYSVDPVTGAATNGVSFAGQGLGVAYGQSFFAEAGADPSDDPSNDPPVVPLPASGLLLLAGLGSLVARKKFG